MCNEMFIGTAWPLFSGESKCAILELVNYLDEAYVDEDYTQL